MASFPRRSTMHTSWIPAPTASSTASWMSGVVPAGSSSLGMARVRGKSRVPRPAAGITALRTTGPVVRGARERPARSLPPRVPAGAPRSPADGSRHKLLLQHTHDDGVVEAAVLENVIPQAALHLESQPPVELDGCLVVLCDV